MAYSNEKNKQNDMRTDYRALIKQEAFRLSEMLLQSPEYAQFIKARDELEADDEQSRLFSELRQQQVAMSMAAFAGEDPDEDNEASMNELCLTVANNALISNYLFAEGRLFHLIAEVEEVFSSKLDLWQTQEMYGSDPVSPLN